MEIFHLLTGNVTLSMSSFKQTAETVISLNYQTEIGKNAV